MLVFRQVSTFYIPLIKLTLTGPLGSEDQHQGTLLLMFHAEEVNRSVARHLPLSSALGEHPEEL